MAHPLSLTDMRIERGVQNHIISYQHHEMHPQKDPTENQDACARLHCAVSEAAAAATYHCRHVVRHVVFVPLNVGGRGLHIHAQQP